MPNALEKEIKLQFPIMLATYPFRDSEKNETNKSPDSVLKPETHYPSTLPIFRPWLHEKCETN